jgi:hypothetical protein
MSYETAQPLEAGDVQIGAVEVVEYLDSEGERRYRIRVDGDMPLSNILGLLVLAQHDAIAMSDWKPSEEDT